VLRQQIEIPGSALQYISTRNGLSVVLETNNSYGMSISTSEAHKLIFVQAPNNPDRHSDDVPALQDKIFEILVCSLDNLSLRMGSY